MAFTGVIAPIPLGTDGLNGSKNYATMSPGSLLEALNITYEDGTIQKEGGASKYNSSAITGAPTVVAGWDWWPTSGTQRMIVATTAGGAVTLRKDSGAGTFPVTLKSGLNAGGVPTFIEAGIETAATGRKLIYVDGANIVQVLTADGATTSDISLPNADWSGTFQPVTGCVHRGRLLLAVGHRVYYSTDAAHQDFQDVTNSGSFNVFPGEGERIVQIMSYKGVVIVWKFPKGLYIIDTQEPSIANWSTKKLSSAVGGPSPHCAVQVNGAGGLDDVLFIDTGGNIQFLSGITDYGILGTRNLSQDRFMGPFLRDNLNLARLIYAQAIFYPAKREVHFGVTQAGAGGNQRRLVVDLNQPGTPRFRWSTRDYSDALWLRKDSDAIERPIAGDESGFVWQLDQSTRSQASSGYTGAFQTAHTDFGFFDQALVHKRKNGSFLEFVINPTGAYTMSVGIYWDGVLSDTKTVSLDGTANTPTVRRVRITGGGRFFSMRCYNSTAAQNFSIAAAYLHFQPGDERT